MKRAVLPLIGLLFLLVGLASWCPAAAETPLATPISSPPSPETPGQLKPVTGYAVQTSVSPELRSISPEPRSIQPLESSWEAPVHEVPLLALPKSRAEPQEGMAGALALDPVLQDAPGAAYMPAPIQSFEGISATAYLPPDTNGDVGPSHYVQIVNSKFAVYDKSGTLLYGPANNNTLWAGTGTPCEARNDGDPIVQYDQLADRWLLSQFALPYYPSGPFYQCIAISRTPDPLGQWYLYSFLVSSNKMNDYPKFGVWPDGYYMTVNQFSPGWAGAGVFAFDRARMLAGDPSASFVYFDLYDVNPNFGGMLPADLDGSTLPPAGSPNYFVEMDDGGWWGGFDRLSLWEFHVDWTNPSSSTFGLAGNPSAVLSTAAFDPNISCSGYNNLECIPQPDTTRKVDVISDRLMYRLAYRNFGDHESLVVNHTVDADGTDRAGIRWYEVRDPGGTPAIYQQGTYSPDSDNRWMGSVAMDREGDIALGYSVASTVTYPSIRYAGRLATDALGTMPQAEVPLIAGGGSQTYYKARWGDYSSLSVDPADDCTFWYTQEYYATTSERGWRTRVGSFRFPACGTTKIYFPLVLGRASW